MPLSNTLSCLIPLSDTGLRTPTATLLDWVWPHYWHPLRLYNVPRTLNLGIQRPTTFNFQQSLQKSYVLFTVTSHISSTTASSLRNTTVHRAALSPQGLYVTTFQLTLTSRRHSHPGVPFRDCHSRLTPTETWWHSFMKWVTFPNHGSITDNTHVATEPQLYGGQLSLVQGPSPVIQLWRVLL